MKANHCPYESRTGMFRNATAFLKGDCFGENNTVIPLTHIVAEEKARLLMLPCSLSSIYSSSFLISRLRSFQVQGVSELEMQSMHCAKELLKGQLVLGLGAGLSCSARELECSHWVVEAEKEGNACLPWGQQWCLPYPGKRILPYKVPS